MMGYWVTRIHIVSELITTYWLYILYRDLMNIYFPRENFCKMKTKYNSPSISRDRHALPPPPHPREDQLDGLKHKFPMLWQTEPRLWTPPFTKRQVTPTPSVVLKAERWIRIFKVHQSPSTIEQEELHRYAFPRKIHLYRIWQEPHLTNGAQLDT